jgi:hypothetical protein
MSSPGKQSKRVAEFRRWLTQEVPRFPNDGATLQVLKNLAITDQMIAYLNWRALRLTASQNGHDRIHRIAGPTMACPRAKYQHPACQG